MEGLGPHEFIATDQITGIWSYLESIDWSERWLHYLCGGHIFLLIISLLTRKMMKFQMFIFCSILAVVYSAERINELAAKNWRLFSKQQYFDSSGMFISLLMSFPLLCISIIITIQWVYQSLLLLAEVKRKQLIHEHSQRQKKDK